jgi:hypothetical protein
MNHVVKPSDECPHCRVPLEIVSVKLKMTGTDMVYACTNCAMTRTECSPSQEILRRFFGALRIIARLGRQSSNEAVHEPAIRRDAG